MTDRRADPERRCLLPEAWPELDQRFWSEACRKGGVLEGSGPAAGWAPATRLAVVKAYGRFINFLARRSLLDCRSAPDARITPASVSAFVATLQGQVTTLSAWSMTSHLYRAAKAMFPEQDWSWLRDVVNRMHAQIKPIHPQKNRLLSPRKAYKAGVRLMEDAHLANGVPTLLSASRFRDGLMLALLAARPLRLKNLTAIDVEKRLCRVGDAYLLRFAADEMKSRRAFEIAVPADLERRIEIYLTTYRPILLQGNETTAMWITQQGCAMRPFSVHHRITRLTKRLFGFPLSVHRFRHSLATSIAIERPEQVRMAVALLGHSQLSTTDRYYITGQSVAASRCHNLLIADARRSKNISQRGTGI